MKNQLATIEDIKSHVSLIKKVMQDVMIEGEHYGIIPGTQKQSLFQTGAQKLLATFRLGSDQEVINTDETENSVSYRVKVRLFNIVDGNTVCYGIGECSSLEDKYAYRKAVSDAEYDAYPQERKRIKFYKDYSVKQVATNYKDVANTILKMAAKRALVSATLTATAAGDIFTQDLEEMEIQTRNSILGIEEGNQNYQGQKSNPATLKEVRDAVSLLGNKTFTKEENGKTLLFVAGNCFKVKDTLKQMGFLYRKPQGAQYGETYMDVTHLIEKSNPLGAPVSNSTPASIEELEREIETIGLALNIVTIDGNDYAEVIGSKIFDNKERIKDLGFKWSNDDSKSWRFDLKQLERNKPSKDSVKKIPLSQLRVKAEIFGYEISDPVVNDSGEWVKAIPIDGDGDSTSLTKELGFSFISSKQMYVLNLAA